MASPSRVYGPPYELQPLVPVTCPSAPKAIVGRASTSVPLPPTVMTVQAVSPRVGAADALGIGAVAQAARTTTSSRDTAASAAGRDVIRPAPFGTVVTDRRRAGPTGWSPCRECRAGPRRGRVRDTRFQGEARDRHALDAMTGL
jgi:hypothetical protein